MEMINIITEDGLDTGETQERKQVHANGLLHRTVHVWVLNDKGELVFQKRKLAKTSYPGLWDISAAGHIASGNSSIDTAVKELAEEIGLVVDKKEFEYLFSIKNKSILNKGTFKDYELSDVYLVRKDVNIDDLVVQEEEVDGIKLVHYRDLISLNDNYVPHVEEYNKLYNFIAEEIFI